MRATSFRSATYVTLPLPSGELMTPPSCGLALRDSVENLLALRDSVEIPEVWEIPASFRLKIPEVWA